ncbi:ankyrin repeat domain-containing protein 9-like [Tachysurus fulvidraco]|uniref:ankyrin repeat domain-containing protein 9-like n=1 Tax=Tachysurus fulvidraco TaxID=1234273 RepID=UPI001FEE9D03|nr:ankyrin repeat domain-containing protein 9-like [Tachysurus fulvidraco]
MGGTCDEHKILTLYQAVKQHEPVQMLEDMRNMEIFHWEECSHQRTYTPSEALMYAIVHDHRDYAQYLLNEFSDGAFATPGEHACCSHSSAPHLALAVHYNRKEIMALILQETSWSYMNRGECEHVDEGRTPLHLACELLHPDVVIMLLGSGASQVENKDGMTPLDLILEQLQASKENTRAKMLCLERMLMFMPELQFKMKSSLKNDPEYWSNVLGEETFNYLVGRIPGTLFLLAMKRTLTQLPSREFFKSLDELPIPAFLKPFPLQPLMQS